MNKKRFIVGVVSVTLVTVSALYFLLYTATGLSWFINQTIAGNHGHVDIQKVHHTLAGNCEITGLHFSTSRITVNFNAIELNWNPLAIFDDQLQVHSINARGVTIHVTDNDTGTSLNSLAITRYPIIASLDKGLLENITITGPHKQSYRFKSVKFNQFYFDKTFFFDKMVARDTGGNTVEISGQAGLRATDIINLSTQVSLRLPGGKTNLRGYGTLVGSTTQLRFLQQVTSPYDVKLEGRVKDLFTKAYWHFNADIHNMTSTSLEPNWPIKSIRGNLAGEGSSAQLELEGNVILQDALGRGWTSTVNAKWDSPRATFKIAAKQPNASPKVDFNVNGQWDYAVGEEFLRTMSLSGQWHNVKWSNDKESSIASRSGRFDFDGSLLRTKIDADHIEINSTGMKIKTLAINTKAQTQNGVDGLVIKGDAKTDQGSLTVSGNLSRSGSSYLLKQLSVTGNHFVLMSNPRAHIIVSPNITLTRDKSALRSTGAVAIPTANIQLQGLRESYGQLAMLLDLDHSDGYGKPRNMVDNINLHFGKSVWVHGYGLNAQVTGDLAVVNVTNRAMLANGELTVLYGNYKQDSQQYSVTDGILKFNKDSLDNPELFLNIAGANLSNGKPGILKGQLQTLFRKQNNGKLALIP
ncbi:MAG: translocation/assembly module TamB domain-containing protein [Gammaproteobacteria bacterium]|jgi:hypothetical protein